jgi:NAD-dependent dihydropyrimidine dehydrogenase PreA subunit
VTPRQASRVDLSRMRFLAPLLRSPWPFFLGRAITLAGFVFTILAGLLGTPVGGRNFAIIFVWIAWWTVLKLVLMPIAGRSWCSICPIPAVGEWLQQGGILRPGKGFGLKLRWPRVLQNQWLQLSGFAIMGLFSAVLLTRPSATGWVLLGLIVAATVLAQVFERRAFCRYLCPIGGYIGWYEQLAPVAVRVRDRAVCRGCVEKACYKNCPWGVFPAALEESFDCGLCMACVRTCPYDNMALWARPVGSELADSSGARGPRRSLDRAWFGLFMLSCAPVYAAVMLGPWGWLTEAAYAIGTRAWLLYALAFLTITLGVGPGLFWLTARAGWSLNGRSSSVRRDVLQLGYALSPLGLSAWVAFTMSFAFGSLAYVWPVLSDPLGLGWNLFGTAGRAWQPYLATATPLLQVAVMIGGLLWTALEVRRTTATRQALPVLGYSSLFTLGMLWLLI